MAGKNQQNPRLVKFINQLMEILKEERNNVDTAVDEYINQIQREVDGFVCGSHDKQATYEEISNRLQHAITFFIAKSDEFSGLISICNESGDCTASNQNTCNSSDSSTCIVNGSSSSQSMTMGKTTVEETLLSLKRTMEHLQEKQEHFDETLKYISNQQENFTKKFEIMTNANSKSQKKLKERLIEVEKTSLESSATVDNLHKVFSVNIDARVNRLEEENDSVNASMNELNKQVSHLRSCNNDVITSTQDLSKRVESTDQHYNEVSDKLKQLEISLNLLSSQYTEQLHYVCSVSKDEVNNRIGMACHLLDKRLAPLEKLNNALNKKLHSGYKCQSKVDDVKINLAESSTIFTHTDFRSNEPNVGFYAWSRFCCPKGLNLMHTFEYVEANYGDHFDKRSGRFTAPKNGLYAISICTKRVNDETFVVDCYQESNSTQSRKRKEANLLCRLLEEQTITRCCELKTGDVVFLKSSISDERPITRLFMHFSCFMIK